MTATETVKAETASPIEAAKDESAAPEKPVADNVVHLYQFPRSPTLPSVSAYCLKVENYLRMTGLKYENVAYGFRWTSKSGNLPFIEINGTEISDSEKIIKDLSTRFDKNLNSGLTPDQLIFTHALESMLNNQTSWLVRTLRYRFPNEFIQASKLDLKNTLRSVLPVPVLNLMFRMGFQRNISGGDGREMNRHSREELIELIKNDVKILSEFLGTKDYFFGKEPHLLDCISFANIAQLIYVPMAGLKEWMETDTPNLISHVERIKEKYWSDWDEICSSLEMNTHLPKKELTEEEIEAKKKEEEKKAEEAKKKEEKQKEKEEKKKQKEEEKAKAKEEKERKKKEAAEAKAKAAAEKAEKEKAEKEKKEAEAKAAAEKAEADKAAAAAAAPATTEATKEPEAATPAAEAK